MTGERLKEILLRYKVSQSEIARQLGISQQSFNQMLSASDVKTSLLERIANVLTVPVSLLYGEECKKQNAVASGNDSVAVAGNRNVIMGDAAVLLERIKALEVEIKSKDLLLEEKERTIRILMGK